MSARLVEIRFGFRTAVAMPSFPIHLDAVLLYANAPRPDLETKARELLDRAIEVRGEGDDRVYCCSALRFDVNEQFVRYNTRHIDMRTYAKDIESGVLRDRAATAVNLNSGNVKGLLVEIPMMWVKDARAFEMVKSQEALDLLLDNVRQIGKYARTGCGIVSSIETDTMTSESQNRWMERVLPFYVDGAAPIRATVFPPYWNRLKIRDAFLHPALLT